MLRLLFALTALAHVPFGVVVYYAAAGVVPAAAWAAAALLAAAGSILLPGRVKLVWIRDRHISLWRRWLVEQPYLVHWCGVVCCAAAACLGLLSTAAGASSLASELPGFGPLWVRVAGLGYAGGLLLGFWAVVVRPRWVVLRTLDVAVEGLGAELAGFRIAQLSDLHIGSLCPPERAARWVRRVNLLDVDLVVLTGDFVTSGVAFHEDIVAVLAPLRARHGVVAVMGNHDYFGDGEPLMSLLADADIRVLRNEWLSLVHDGARLTLVGIDDRYTKRADVDAAFRGCPTGEPRVVLVHDPALGPAVARHGPGLVLSGHTHGRQVALPLLSSWRRGRGEGIHRIGLFREGETTLHISPGLGTTGPPMRMGIPPEITVLRLGEADRR